MDKPKPVPFPISFVVKNGSNILSMFFFSIPTPLSDICIKQWSFSFCVEILMFPVLFGVASIAFEITLTNT